MGLAKYFGPLGQIHRPREEVMNKLSPPSEGNEESGPEEDQDEES